jgi:hypothetical protein
MRIRKNSLVRFIKDASGDLPKSLVGRRAVVLSRQKDHDEIGKLAFTVRFTGYKKTHVLWDDELEFIEQLPSRNA